MKRRNQKRRKEKERKEGKKKEEKNLALGGVIGLETRAKKG